MPIPLPPVLAFDMETVPDVDGLRLLHGFPADVSDAEVVEMAQRLQRQKKNNDFLPLYLHRIVTISCVLRRDEKPPVRDDNPLSHGDDKPMFKVFTLPTDHGNEASAIDIFFRVMQKYMPMLVSWNGGGFDLPVLHYRAMKHNIAAPVYWRTDNNRQSYTNRYHERHLDLMDVLSLYQPQARVPLDEFAKLCGLPGKIGVGGAGVWEAFQQGDYEAIRRYCETDAMLTYLLYVRFQQFRGRMDGHVETLAVRDFLRDNPSEQWNEFLQAWPE